MRLEQLKCEDVVIENNKDLGFSDLNIGQLRKLIKNSIKGLNTSSAHLKMLIKILQSSTFVMS